MMSSLIDRFLLLSRDSETFVRTASLNLIQAYMHRIPPEKWDSVISRLIELDTDADWLGQRWVESLLKKARNYLPPEKGQVVREELKKLSRAKADRIFFFKQKTAYEMRAFSPSRNADHAPSLPGGGAPFNCSIRALVVVFSRMFSEPF